MPINSLIALVQHRSLLRRRAVKVRHLHFDLMVSRLSWRRGLDVTVPVVESGQALLRHLWLCLQWFEVFCYLLSNVASRGLRVRMLRQRTRHLRTGRGASSTLSSAGPGRNPSRTQGLVVHVCRAWLLRHLSCVDGLDGSPDVRSTRPYMLRM